MAKIKPAIESNIRIKVVGVGGAGGNVVTRMKERRFNEQIELIAINTDFQGLHYAKADLKIHIGKDTCRGLGAGMDPEKGRESAEENNEEISQALKDGDLIFLTCGLGGGTGSGAAPIIANICRQLGSLVIAVVTKPFIFEGTKRMEIAEEAWRKLHEQVDAIVTIPNDRIFNIIERETPILEAFSRIDEILRQGVEGVSNLITFPGIINLDFANIRAIMEGAGSALMGIGKAKGVNRAKEAAQLAIKSPLLDISIEGATRVLFNVSGQKDMSLVEVHDAARLITEAIAKDAKVIFGTSFDDHLRKGEIKITVIAGGFEGELRKIGPSLPLEIKIRSSEIKDEKEEDFKDKTFDFLFKEEELETPAFLKKKRK